MQPFMNRNTINVRIIRYLDDHIGKNSLAQITADLQIDRNTVKKHLSELQNLISQHFDEQEMQLNYQANQGAEFKRRLDVNLNQVMLLLTKESTLTKLLKATFEGDTATLTEFAERNFISYSTAKRYVKQLQPHLALYGLKYSPANNQLLGQETMVRLCYYRIYWETYAHFEWPFIKFTKAAVQVKVQAWLLQNQIDLEPLAQLQLCYWWVICQQRQKEHPITLPAAALAAQWQQQPLSNTAIFKPTLTAENSFFFYCYIFFTIQQVPVELQPSSLVQQATKLTVQILQQQLHQRLSAASVAAVVQQLTILHSYSLIFPIGGLLLERDSVYKRVNAQRPWLVKQLKTVLAQEQQTKSPVFQNTEYLLVNYVPLVTIYFNVSQLNPILKIYLLIDSTVIYRQWLTRQIEHLLQAKYWVQPVNQLSDCDLVITNVDVNIVDHPVIVINTPLNQRDRLNVQQFKK